MKLTDQQIDACATACKAALTALIEAEAGGFADMIEDDISARDIATLTKATLLPLMTPQPSVAQKS